ncbi:MAG TPA: hypothetical protein VE553_00450 [Candidatus Binatia bacterium]|jgi:hypothetical protein|nr:hypothetical protein [Candidatus Binatia bacterium]
MTITVIVHIANEEPVVCEVEKLPEAQDQVMLLSNPRMRDGKELKFLEEDVSRIIVPWHRINYVQVLPSAEIEDVIGFVRD